MPEVQIRHAGSTFWEALLPLGDGQNPVLSDCLQPGGNGGLMTKDCVTVTFGNRGNESARKGGRNMENRGPVFEKSNSVENVYHLRLTALLRELVRDGGFKGAAQALDIDQRTVARSFRSGVLSRAGPNRAGAGAARGGGLGGGGAAGAQRRSLGCSMCAVSAWRAGPSAGLPDPHLRERPVRAAVGTARWREARDAAASAAPAWGECPSGRGGEPDRTSMYAVCNAVRSPPLLAPRP